MLNGYASTAYGTFVLSMSLVLGRPRLGRWHVGPVAAVSLGVVLMLVLGILTPRDLVESVVELARPLVGVVSIVLSAAIAREVGLLDRLAHFIVPAAKGPVWRAFLVVFLLGVFVSGVFNNDAAILLLTPLVVPLTRTLYPVRPYLIVPFAFAVFSAAGVAPLVISNPMNFVVATYAGISFNGYAARMTPVALACWLVALVVLALLWRKQIADPVPARGRVEEPGSLPRVAREVAAVLFLTLSAFPVVTAWGGPAWMVSATGAALLIVLVVVRGAMGPRAIVEKGPWEVLGFLLGMFLLVRGLRNVGVVDRLTALYASLPPGAYRLFGVGMISALGSALLNNHPMALLNALALDAKSGGDTTLVLAALVGGDLGPRLLPTGSLAGLLWLDVMRKEGFSIPLRQFVGVGALLTFPSLLVALGVLYLVAP